MRGGKIINAIIPALNEEQAIGNVLKDIPDWVDHIIVVDNGSTDRTSEIALNFGVEVVFEPIKGYGRACLSGLEVVGDCDVIVFIDGDYSDYANEMDILVDPIIHENYDLVIGSRTTGNIEDGALTAQQKFGNWLACKLIFLLWGKKYTDLGPFRAIQSQALKKLSMIDNGYGWTIEMQIKAILKNLKVLETPVKYRTRIGVSKISGTFWGSVSAGTKILTLIFWFAIKSFTSYGSQRKSLII